MSRITAVEPIHLQIPFQDGSEGIGLFPERWDTLDILLVRIETGDGLVGWGEGFGYSCAEATAAMVRRGVAPLLIGEDARDIAGLNRKVQQRMVLPGRFGISTFALSGADIALWDLAGKREGVSASRLIGERRQERVAAYASLVRYGNTEAVGRFATRAEAEGYPVIKLHEVTMPEIRSARAALQGDTALTIDVNCGWDFDFSREVIPELIALGCSWLEEPLFPPEDGRALVPLRGLGIPIAAGENLCTASAFKAFLGEGGIDIAQPSVTKVGGITEVLSIRNACTRLGVRMVLHCPYFGPGYLASLQLSTDPAGNESFEYLYIEPEAWLYPLLPRPVSGHITIPDSPGLGMDPDPGVIAHYRVG
ncbi:MAG: mandelate racemase/muconate lactonizing enzyme family protein [Oceanipulchritudo sp.]